MAHVKTGKSAWSSWSPPCPKGYSKTTIRDGFFVLCAKRVDAKHVDLAQCVEGSSQSCNRWSHRMVAGTLGKAPKRKTKAKAKRKTAARRKVVHKRVTRKRKRGRRTRR